MSQTSGEKTERGTLIEQLRRLLVEAEAEIFDLRMCIAGQLELEPGSNVFLRYGRLSGEWKLHTVDNGSPRRFEEMSAKHMILIVRIFPAFMQHLRKLHDAEVEDLKVAVHEMNAHVREMEEARTRMVNAT